MTHLTLMNLDTAEEFFRRCLEAKAVNEEDRSKILVQLIKEKKAEYLGATKYGKATVARKLGGKYIGKSVRPSVPKETK